MHRTLFFDVRKQELKKNKNCDFSNIVNGTKKYLLLQFSFDSSWNGTMKVLQASNYSDFYKDFAVPIYGNKAYIPDEVTDGKRIYIKVYGKNKDYMICTNKILIEQEG